MRFIIKLLITAALVMGLAQILPGIGITNYVSAILVALTLSILNFIVKPILVILTLPITIVTLGIFLLFINVIIIYLADWFVDDFTVTSVFWAFIFSLLLAAARSFLFKLLDKEDN
ncbi:phage holin family protein [uncultured Nonlabens sp.]|uniref:phage holin family protein n=1 Tax=uncultured Nonlabens sp. TaxID=859306 RepID=UPI0026162FFB|nr:phage holin family protein [uncultured Nonlabens sp.]